MMATEVAPAPASGGAPPARRDGEDPREEETGNAKTATKNASSSNALLGHVRFYECDATDAMREFVLEVASSVSLGLVDGVSENWSLTDGACICTQSLTMLIKGDLKRYHQVAEMVSRGLVEKFGGAWHTIVGKSFGSFVTHETASLMYFFIGPIGFLTFKHG